jgi:hypothetical protein
MTRIDRGFVAKHRFHQVRGQPWTSVLRNQNFSDIEKASAKVFVTSVPWTFLNVLTGPLLLQLTATHLPAHREPLYPPSVTLSMLRQGPRWRVTSVLHRPFIVSARAL